VERRRAQEHLRGTADREWDWNKIEIKHDGRVLPAEKVAIATGETHGELQVQGAMMISTTPIVSQLEPGTPCLLLELLFAAPRNRPDLNKTGDPFLRGAGTQLLRWAAWFSQEMRCDGRLRLDASPRSIKFYQGKGLQILNHNPIVFEGVQYTPMELTQAAALKLLAD